MRRIRRRKIQFAVQEQIPELQRVEQYIHMGDFGKALREIEKLEKKGGLDEDGQLRSQILKTLVIIESGQPDTGLEQAEKVFIESEKTGSALTIIDALVSKATALFYLSKLTESLKVINDAENILTTLVKDHVEFAKRESALKLLQGRVYRRTGDFDLALEFLEKCLSTRMGLGIVYATGDPLNEIGIIYAQKGQFDFALSYLQQALKVFEDAGNKAQIVKIRNNVGMIYSNTGDLDQALEFYEKALAISEELENKRFISAISLNIGRIFAGRGELNLALDYYQRCLGIFEEQESKAEEAICLNNIGTVYETKGELDQALDAYQRALAITETLNMKQELAVSLNNIASIHREKGDYEAANRNYLRSLEIFEEIGNKYDMSETLANLIRVAVYQGTAEDGEPYLEKLKQISGEEDNKIIDLICRLSNATLLRTSDRMVKRAEAQQIFQQIAEEEIIHFGVTSEAMFNLCELLYMELETSGSEEALKELKSLLDHLLTIAEEQHSYPVFVEAHLLQSKTALLELDVEKARQVLTQAQQFAEEKGLQRLAMMASGEYDSLLTQISKWDSLIKSEASMQERLQLARLEQMVTGLIRKQEVEVAERPPEEPVMLLILAESGLTMFSQTFGDDSQLDDQLVGGFLTAVTGFGAEVFSGSGAIDRIQYQDYTVASKTISSMMFCYMFKGQSYSALQKLDQFMDVIQENSPIWDGLARTLTTGQTLDDPEEASLGAIISEIF
ncbi:MAG: tetratricopeptide repeat protein [Candidatus Heimdallarchaeota archaeon]